MGWYDVNKACGDGCECQASVQGATCGGASSLGALALGTNVTTTGNLVPLGTEAWFTVSFQSNTDTRYHPQIQLTNPVGEFLIDVYADCSNTLLTCATEGGNSKAVTNFEMVYTAGDPASAFQPIPALGGTGKAFIRVYRAPGKPLSCNNFALRASN